METHIFMVKRRSRSPGTKRIAGVGQDTLVSAGFLSFRMRCFVVMQVCETHDVDDCRQLGRVHRHLHSAIVRSERSSRRRRSRAQLQRPLPLPAPPGTNARHCGKFRQSAADRRRRQGPRVTDASSRFNDSRARYRYSEQRRMG